MTSIVTMTMADDRIKQVVSTDDPVEIYDACKALNTNGRIKAYSIITMKDHVMGADR